MTEKRRKKQDDEEKVRGRKSLQDDAVPVDEAIRNLSTTACCSSDTVRRKSEVECHCNTDPEESDDDGNESSCIAGCRLVTTGEHRTVPVPFDEADESLLVEKVEEFSPDFPSNSGFRICESVDELRKCGYSRMKKRREA